MLSANSFNIDWGGGGVGGGRGGGIDKNIQVFDCSKVFWPEL